MARWTGFRPRLSALWALPVVAVLLVVATEATYLAGGTRTVFPHLFYIPVIVAAVAWGPVAAAGAGVVAGMLAGPLMPLDVDAGVAQAPLGWILRTVFFVVIGVLTGMLTLSSRSRVRELEMLVEEGVRAFVRAVDAKSRFTARHSERVAECAVLLCGALGLSRSQIERVRWAALLHDVGKIATPDDILNKAGPLTPEEWAIVRSHPEDSVRILEGIGQLGSILPAVRHHHERVDGTGYPDGVRGDDLSLDARILAVADAFEAMTSERPYRRGKTKDEAIDELRRGAGSQFDPTLVEPFVRALGPEGTIEQVTRRFPKFSRVRSR